MIWGLYMYVCLAASFLHIHHLHTYTIYNYPPPSLLPRTSIRPSSASCSSCSAHRVTCTLPVVSSSRMVRQSSCALWALVGAPSQRGHIPALARPVRLTA
jgi:hypothetical protein